MSALDVATAITLAAALVLLAVAARDLAGVLRELRRARR